MIYLVSNIRFENDDCQELSFQEPRTIKMKVPHSLELNVMHEVADDNTHLLTTEELYKYYIFTKLLYERYELKYDFKQHDEHIDAVDREPTINANLLDYKYTSWMHAQVTLTIPSECYVDTDKALLTLEDCDNDLEQLIFDCLLWQLPIHISMKSEFVNF